METKQITQGHIYYLVLNGVYDRCEERNVVAVAETPETLISLYNNNILPNEERYRDNLNKYRSFKKGILYDYNPLPFQLNGTVNCDGLGIKDTWVDVNDLYDIKSRYNWVEEQTYL